jgi:hypothetical protein
MSLPLAEPVRLGVIGAGGRGCVAWVREKLDVLADSVNKYTERC